MFFADHFKFHAQISATVSSGSCEWYPTASLLNLSNVCLQGNRVYCSHSLSGRQHRITLKLLQQLSTNYRWRSYHWIFLLAERENYSTENRPQSVCKGIPGHRSWKITEKVSRPRNQFLLVFHLELFWASHACDCVRSELVFGCVCFLWRGWHFSHNVGCS